jgi:glycosyltransferase involved in cell wall biosynthesis
VRDQNIVCIAKDWSEDPTSNNHVMRMLARDNRVLWLNSIATRSPNLGNGRDLAKIARKLGSFMQGPVQVADNLDVYTPIVLPYPHVDLAVQVNTVILRESLRLLRAQRRMDDFQLWSFLPVGGRYVGKLGERLAVYYCTDEWSKFSTVEGAGIAAMERELCEKADLVFTTSRTLLESKKAYNPETHLASHGVDQKHFAKAFAADTQVAAELRDLPRPILGFVGLIQDWVDIGLIEHLATKRKDWTIVIVGKAMVDVSRLEALPNVKLLGRKPYESLPTYVKAFDLGLIPFVHNELTRNVNPIKLREYFSAGLPVVSSDMPEVALYANEGGALAGACRIGRNHDDFYAACVRALAEDSAAKRAARSTAMEAETWERRVADITEHVTRVRINKR